MSDMLASRDLASRLAQTATEIGLLAKDATEFNALLTAFRADSGERFSAILAKFQLRPFCYEICRWFCSKECVLRCIEIAGLPTTAISVDIIPQFAQVIGKITADKAIVQRLADVIDKADPNAYSALLKDLQLEAYRHLLCHWACAVRCRLRCRLVCAPVPVPVKQFAGELSLAGAAIARISANTSLKNVIAASIALNCKQVTDLLGGFSDCILICEWICSWRCVLVCLPLCLQFPPNKDTSVAEILAFAEYLSTDCDFRGRLSTDAFRS